MKLYCDIKNLILEIYYKRYAIYELAKRDFQASNKESYLGSCWGYLQPIIFITILWFVFEFGLRANPGGDVPFVVYLTCGFVPWLFFSETLGDLTIIIRQHAFLIKKQNFSLHILPLSKMLSSLIPHLSLMAVTLAISSFHGIYPSLYTFQLFYYFISMFLLLLGLGWITASTSIFVRDVSNVVTILIQFGFWLTPIFWNISLVPEKHQWILKLNPVYYIVSGYRDSIIYKTPIWSKPYETLYFWFFTISVVLLGSVVFKRLKPHFAEVL
jgi:lipopolysaccharide transport system permease protein/teichoic acid transport system permease protein